MGIATGAGTSVGSRNWNCAIFCACGPGRGRPFPAATEFATEFRTKTGSRSGSGNQRGRAAWNWNRMWACHLRSPPWSKAGDDPMAGSLWNRNWKRENLSGTAIGPKTRTSCFIYFLSEYILTPSFFCLCRQVCRRYRLPVSAAPRDCVGFLSGRRRTPTGFSAGGGQVCRLLIPILISVLFYVLKYFHFLSLSRPYISTLSFS